MRTYLQSPRLPIFNPDKNTELAAICDKKANSHVHQAIKESPFFLTFLQSPRLHIFNPDKPRTLYGQTYVDEAFKNLQVSYQFVKDNLNLAVDVRTEYFNCSVEKRFFKIGEKVLVKFSMVATGVNPKFLKKWRGNFIVMKKVGNLNLLVRASLHSKQILVYVDRVKHMHIKGQLVSFNPDLGKDFLFQQDSDVDEHTDGPVKHYSADFGNHESASSSGEESEEVAEPAPPELPAPVPPVPASLLGVPEHHVTQGAARDLGVFVLDVHWGDMFWSSSTHRK